MDYQARLREIERAISALSERIESLNALVHSKLLRGHDIAEQQAQLRLLEEAKAAQITARIALITHGESDS